MKNETVIGMIGHTQGVKIAIKPPSKPIRNTIHRLLPASDSLPSSSAAGAPEAAISAGETPESPVIPACDTVGASPEVGV